MKRYHITYTDKANDKRCKGINIDAKNESKALKKFNKSHKGAEFEGMVCKGKVKDLFR